jgi:hypothetical protein
MPRQSYDEPVAERHDYLVAYDYGMGGSWGHMLADSEE